MNLEEASISHLAVALARKCNAIFLIADTPDGLVLICDPENREFLETVKNIASQKTTTQVEGVN